MRRSLIVFLFPIVAMLSSTQAQADACGGQIPFNDISQNDFFCSDATWAKNAGIVAGCNATDLCAHSPVTRAQAVAFLSRMAFATFPFTTFAESAVLPAGDLDSPGVSSCTTVPVPILATSNFSFAHVHALVSMRAGANADVQMSVTRSLDGAAFSPIHTVSAVATVPAGQWVNASAIAATVLLPPGTSSRWRIDLSRATGSGTTGELTDLQCQLKVVRSMSPTPPI